MPLELLVDRHESVINLTLNRPDKMNALSPDLVERLIEEVTEASMNTTRLLVLRGNGKSFCAGFDLSGLESQSDGDLLLRLIRIEALLQAIYYAPFPVLALAHGNNFGAGADLVCACTRRVGTPDSGFRMPGLRFGVVLGTRRLAETIGTDAAREILGATRRFDAAQARGVKFLTDVRPEAVWSEVIEETLADLCTLPSGSTANLLECSRRNSRADDMDALVRSASIPGLNSRISAYVSGMKAGR